MAETQAATSQNDKVQDLITALNTIEGIDFTEDAWVEKAPANYGVVELTGESANDYADGIKIAQAFAVRVTAYVTGGSHQWITTIQGVLDAQNITYSMPQRDYLDDIQKVRWIWNCQIRMPVIYPGA